MKTLTYHYTKIQLVQSATVMHFFSLGDLCAYTEMHQLHNIFILFEKNAEARQFAVVHNNILMKHDALGYETLADFINASQNEFPDAAVYYKAAEEGYKKYSEYVLVKEAGIGSKAIFDKMRDKGFVKGYDDILALQKDNDSLPQMNEVANPYQLYCFATDNGFENYAEFKTAYVKGFTESLHFKIASESGFGNAADYKEALQKGFRTFAELSMARAEKIRDGADLARRLQMETVGNKENSYDQKLLMILLSKIEQGKKVSLNKLHDLFQKSMDEYRYSDDNEIPGWFTREFDDKEKLVEFLLKENQLKKYGEYDNDGEFFQVNLLQNRKVVIDGSNVAYNSNNNNNHKPLVANILKVAAYLQRKGFTEITVIADASLKHKLGDADKLEKLEKSVDYLVAPPENPADIFIINYVKKTHCLLVSNDNFREWKISDPWIAVNIDFYKLSFMVKGDEVLMPDLR